MICYMPFTVLDEHQIELLANDLDVLTVYCPAEVVVPSRMRAWEQKGILDIRHPQGVNGEQLLSAIQNYKAWADLHQGRIGDMAGFFQSQHGRFPMMDDTNPTQIGHQIRHYGESTKGASENPLFTAALFLSMAQEYDEHHLGMAQDMDAVHALEQKMLNQMTGGGRDVEKGMPVPRTSPQSPGHTVMDDPYMTSQRVQAWSRLALEDPHPPLLYLTASRIVMEHLLDIFPDAKKFTQNGLALSRNPEEIQTLAFESDLQSLELTSEVDDPASENAPDLTIYCLVGISPADFLARLADFEPAAEVTQQQGRGPTNTLIGLVTTR